MTIRSTSKLRCEFEKTSPELFFSLVDYRNNLFTSNETEKIIEFYTGFDNRDQLIQWMKERPKGMSYIHEVEGDKDIIVVIPTADFNGKYAINCRENIFKGLHMIFVESGGKDDIYFNYAHNCNVGIKKAMEYNPKWIALSNDDMIGVDPVQLLRTKLMNVNPEEYKIVFTRPSKYHSIPTCVAERGLLDKIIVSVIRRKKIYKTIDLLDAKFNVKFRQQKKIPLVAKNPIYFTLASDFAILSSALCQEYYGYIFDETYINAYEDLDLSLRLRNQKNKTIDYKINDLFGSTLGNNECRMLRSFAGVVLLNYKLVFNRLRSQ